VCTALISVDPAGRVPVLLLFARDEMADRSWLRPDRHWPERPRVVGGRDLREGGTWLAVHPGGAGHEQAEGTAPSRARVACLLNALGRPVAPERRLTRGRLPLAAAEGALVHRLDLGRYDPFHLLTAEAGAAGVSLLTWDGERLGERRLGAGTHLVSNRGLEAEEAPLPEAPLRAVRLIDARIRHFRPLLEQTPRPAPEPGRGTTRQAWGEWMRLAGGDGLATDDMRALIGRHDWGHGQVWLTSSVSLVALGRRDVRFDFNADPGGEKGRTDDWAEIPVEGEAEGDPRAGDGDGD
jgi:hypothetical protein